ncbi:alpha/beta-hydrolase [Neoconidiobolus thromboides FSU 785]|nr:alpha/beta-hydrolase [Neoconidiobolus thromboides FSU 785]KAI9292617.1 alpha/beta-hydrolase [Neoconidiobolus thromboides FSU 785]
MIVWPHIPLKSKLLLPINNLQNITYTGDTSNWINSYDVYLPKDQSINTPLLIWIHGGAWVSGDKRDDSEFASKLADLGIATVVLNYRLSSSSNSIKYPDHILDCFKGFSHVLNNKKQLNINPDLIFLGGHSAGSQISSMMALNANHYLPKNNHILDSVSKIKGVISLGGIFDLPLLYKQDYNYGKKFLNIAFNDDNSNKSNTTIWKQASPQFVSKKAIDTIHYSPLPQVLLINSIQDPLVHQNQSIHFQDKLNEIGFNTTLVNGEFGDHYAISNNLSVIQQVATFITFVAKLKPKLI